MLQLRVFGSAQIVAEVAERLAALPCASRGANRGRKLRQRGRDRGLRRGLGGSGTLFAQRRFAVSAR
jgi:hypothetical protein